MTEPIIVHVHTELDGEAHAQIHGKRVSWVDACCFAAFLALLVGCYILIMW